MKTKRTYYVISGGYNVGQFFLAPVYPLFLLSRGLDLFQINVVFAIYLLTAFSFDIPTGAVADRFGRKTSFMLACAFRTVAFLYYSRAASLTDCIVGELIDGVGATLATGALDAWAVDGVRAEGDHRPTDRMFARAQVIAQAAMIGGGIVCGYIGQHDLALPWLVGAAIFATTGVTAGVLMREGPRHASAGRSHRLSLHSTIAGAIAAVSSSRPLLLLCALTLASAFAAFPVYHYWQPQLQALTGEGPWLIGWVLAAVNLAGLAASAVLPRLIARFGRARVLVAASLWRGTAIAIAAAATRAPLFVAGMMLHGAGTVSEPLLAAWTNEHVDAAARATVLSVRSTFLTLGGALGLLSLGLVARAHGIAAAWSVSATVLICAAPCYLALARISRVPAPDLGIEMPLPPSKVSTPSV